MKKIFLLSLACLATLSACAQPIKAPEANLETPKVADQKLTESKPAENKAVEAKDLCQLLTADQVSAILGYTVTTKPLIPASATLTSCNYESTDTDLGFGLTIIANYDNQYQTAKSAYQLAIEGQAEGLDPAIATVSKITGVGEEASFTDAPFNAILIAVNKNVWLTASMAGDSAERNEQIKTIVNAAFEVL
jgi:hypothetical protein